MQVRRDLLTNKSIADLCHALTESERVELVKGARQEYEKSEQQLALQERDAETWKATCKTAKQGADGTKCSRGAPQPASK